MVGDGRGPAQRGGHPHLGHQGPGRAVPRRAHPQPQGTGRGHPQGRRGENLDRRGGHRGGPGKAGRAVGPVRRAGCGRTWTGPREICRRYNDAFNAIVLRSYDDVQLSLPGVNRDIKPFWWQKAAIARMIYEPTAGLFHDMGAGKTLEQIIGVMEQKRLGLIRKPVICVKNHLLDQFRDEFLWAYPQARIMCADTDDLAGDGRRQFIARCAAENPDAIIMTRGAFESIPLTPEGHEAYLDYMKQMFAVHAEAVTEHGQGRGDAAGRVRAAAARLLRSRRPAGRRGGGRAGPQAGQAQGRAGPRGVLGADGRRLHLRGRVAGLQQPVGSLRRAGHGDRLRPPVHRPGNETARHPPQVRQPGLHARHGNPRSPTRSPSSTSSSGTCGRSGSRRRASPATRRGPRPTPNPSSGWR